MNWKNGECYHTINGMECPYNFKDSEIVSSWTNPEFTDNRLKGASAGTDKVIMKVLKPEVKYQLAIQSLENIRNMFGFNNNNNQLKGASNDIPNVCDKTKSFMNLKRMVGLI